MLPQPYESRNIFRKNTDREDIISRFSRILMETETPCYAWALLSNHFHLLLRAGNVPITIVMRRVLTGYVVSFNRRYHRTGPLFQNRYKSILCQEDSGPALGEPVCRPGRTACQGNGGFPARSITH